MARRLYVTDTTGDELWRSTVETPTAAAHFEEVLNFPSGLTAPFGITSHLDRLYVLDNTGGELWRSTVAEPTATSHFEEVLNFPSGLTAPLGITSHLDRLYVLDNTGDELWRSTVADPTATSHFEEVLNFPSGLTAPLGITSHADRLYVVDWASSELWRSTVADPTATSHFEEVLNFPSGLTGPRGITSHNDRLYVVDASGAELWRSTVETPTATAHFEKVLDFPSGLTGPRGITSHDPDPIPDPLESEAEVRAQNPQISAAATVVSEQTPLSAQGEVRAQNPAVSGAATLGTGPFDLGAWDRTGLTVEFAALITSGGSGGTLFAIPPRGTTGTLDDGDFLVGPDDAPITRILVSGDTLTFNDNSAFAWSVHYGSGGAGENQSIHFQTESDGTYEAPISDILRATNPLGGGFLTITMPTALATIVNGISGGNSFIVGFYEAGVPATPDPLAATAEMESDDPTIVAAATLESVSLPDPLVGAGTVTAAPPSISAAATVVEAVAEQLYVADSSGDALWLINQANPDDEAGAFGLVGSFPSGLTFPGGITSHAGSLYVADNTGDELWLDQPGDAERRDRRLRARRRLPVGADFPWRHDLARWRSLCGGQLRRRALADQPGESG